MVEVTLKLNNKLGLHARPAAELTKTAARFKSSVSLYGEGKTANAKSIIMVLSMGIKEGHELTIRADGEDEKECIQALKALVESKFNEE